MRRWFSCLLAVGAVMLAVSCASPAHAMSLEIRPLEYKTTLKEGESQKGYINVTNPSAESVRIKTEVQAFRQVDDRGSLQFYDSDRMAAGILPDLDEFDLASGETARVYFVLDGTKLASGDNFGALFFRIIPERSSGVNSSLRLGTLFMIANASQTDHRATIASFDVPFFQFGDGIRGRYSVTNIADPKTTNAFYPQVELSVTPLKRTVSDTSSLVFAGRTRTNDFHIDTFRFGFYAVTLEYNGTKYTRLIFVANHWQLLIAALFVCALILGVYLLIARQRRRK